MTDAIPERRLPAWLGPAIILLVVVLGYAIGPTRLPLVGEETCRARHGVEMAASGDWLVATQQGVEILDRPPLQYWVYAIIHEWIHPLDPMTLRLSAVVIVLATSLVVWWYARQFLTEAGAIVAGVAYPTMGHVFDLGRRVETDSMFAFLLATSMLVWHAGYAGRWRPAVTWTVSCAIAALAALAKGTQAPVAFFGAAYLYVLLRRDLRSLFRPAHFLGLAVFVGLIAIWQVPFYLVAGWEGTRMTWLDPGASRVGASARALLEQLVTFPALVIGATLPWSGLLLGLVDPRLWRLDERPKAALQYALVGMAAIFVPVWITQGGHHRYVMPMYPLMAVACGVVVQRCLAFDLSKSPRRFWRDYVRICAIVIAGTALFFGVVTLVDRVDPSTWTTRLAQPLWLVGVLLVGGAAATWTLLGLARSDRPDHIARIALTIAAALAVGFNGPVLNAFRKKAANIGPDVVAIHDLVGPDRTLVSFGPVHHKFVYWYDTTIPILERPETTEELPPDIEYFAIDVSRGEEIDLPFEWERIALLNMDRTVTEDPEHQVLVGRVVRRP